MLQRLSALWSPLPVPILILAFAPATFAGEVLELHFIDVGQGHATLVRSPTGRTVLVDGGPPGAGSAAIAPYLVSIGVGAIDYGVATHYDADHIGGLDEVFDAGYGPTLSCYDRGDFNIPSNGNVSGYLASIAGQRAQAVVGLTLVLGGGAELEFLVENGNYPGGSVNAWAGAQPENSSSVGMVVRLGDFEAWIGGDLTGGGNSTVNVESFVAPHVGRVEVALANHHGSRTSSNSTFVSLLDPSVVIYGCGLNNPFGHPDQQILDRWNSVAGSRVQWSTTPGDTSSGSAGFLAAEGTIVVRSDGTTFELVRAGEPLLTRFATHEASFAAAGPGDLGLSEVLVDPLASSDTFGEWFEVLGRGTGARHLGGLQVESGTQSFTLASKLLIGPGERLLFGLDGWRSRNGAAPLDHAAPWGSLSFANGADGLALRAGGGALIESVAWGPGGFTVSPGLSKERIDFAQPPTAANFADALGAWAGGDWGTPRAINDNEVQGCASNATSYCIAAPNSTGVGARMGHAGSLDVSVNDFVLSAAGGPPGQFGIFYYGPSALQQPFGDGFRCVGGTAYRLPVVQIGAAGGAQWSVDFTSPPQPGGQISGGSTWHFQLWYRDPQGPGGTGFNFSDGLAVAFCATPHVIAAGDVVLTEFLADPDFVADAAGEWLEIANTTGVSLDLAGWMLEDGSGGSHEITGLVVPAGALAVLGREASPALNGGVAVDYAYGSAIELGDSDGILRLSAPGGLVVDEVAYQAPFFPLAAGAASSLDPDHVDELENDNSAFWCLAGAPIGGGNSDLGTPGTPNPSCP